MGEKDPSAAIFKMPDHRHVKGVSRSFHETVTTNDQLTDFNTLLGEGEIPGLPDFNMHHRPEDHSVLLLFCKSWNE